MEVDSIFFIAPKALFPEVVDSIFSAGVNVSLIYGNLGFNNPKKNSQSPAAEEVDYRAIDRFIKNKTSKETLAFYSIWETKDHFYRILSTLAYDLNRESGLGSLRFVDRFPQAKLMLQFWIEKFLFHKPNLIMFWEPPVNADKLAALFVAQEMGVNVLWMEMVPGRFPLLLPALNGKIINARMIEESTEARSSRIRFRDELIQDFEKIAAGGQPHWVRPAKSKRQKNKTSARKKLQTISQQVRNMEGFPTPLGDKLQLDRLVFGYIRYRYKTRLKKQLRGSSLDMKNLPLPFVLFPLHYQPERTSIPLGPLVPDQSDLVIKTRAFISDELSLVVKWHPDLLLHEGGWRAMSTLAKITYDRLWKTYTVNGEYSNDILIESASAVVTITGTSGIESLLRGTPVLYFGNPWWRGAPGSAKIESRETEKFAKNGIEIPVPPERHQLLEWVRNRLDETMLGFPDNPDYLSHLSLADQKTVRTSAEKSIVQLIAKFSKGSSFKGT